MWINGILRDYNIYFVKIFLEFLIFFNEYFSCVLILYTIVQKYYSA